MVYRRQFLQRSFLSIGLLASSQLLLGCSGGQSQMATPSTELETPDVNGLQLPPNVTSRVVARSGDRVVSGSDYIWHSSPDGGATFATTDGGWVYVSNSERDDGRGAVGALRFDANANLVDAYSILEGTNRNCAGGATPWQTWLSCEEVGRGLVWECQPLGGPQDAVARPALGIFRHEAVAVDPLTSQLYLTEDQSDGRFYRFTPASDDNPPDLTDGTLEVAEIQGGTEGPVVWHPVPDPSAANTPTRRQVPVSTPFNQGEGMDYRDGVVYFSTTGDNRVWAYDIVLGTLSILYDDDFFVDPKLTGVDNVAAAPDGDILVAEDGGDMQIVAIAPDGQVRPIVQVIGHPSSEITGPAFDPSGTRLYFSSQRGSSGSLDDGVTFEISGMILT